jgi:hypothetical protein
MKGQMVAIEQASIAKKCDIQFQGKPWRLQLERFIRDAIAAGQEIAPLSVANRIITGCEGLRKH